MEDALRDYLNMWKSIYIVLILVLMEDALREGMVGSMLACHTCLNPCSNGRCSARTEFRKCDFQRGYVLILVLMEDALREGGYDFFA